MANNNEVLQLSSKLDYVTTESRMTNKPKVEVRAGQPYVSIPVKADLKEWSQVNELVEEIFGWLGEKGVQPNGAPFFRYWVIGDMNKKFKLEVGVPIVSTTFGDDRVITGTIPAGKYITLVHNGHPDSLVNSFTVLEEWASGQGINWDNRNGEVCGDRFEFYWTDPAVEPDLEKWSIEVAYLIKE